MVSLRNSTKTTLLIVHRLFKVSRCSRTSSVRAKYPFKFIMETACLAKQDEPSFMKKRFAKDYEPPPTIHDAYQLGMASIKKI